MQSLKVAILLLSQLVLVWTSSSTPNDHQPGSTPVNPGSTTNTQNNGPEPRQITAPMAGVQSGIQGASSPSAVYPYNMYANSVYGAGPKAQTPSSSPSSFFSFLRPSSSGSGRRSSLTSKLRNFMSSIFYRQRGAETPYIGSGSSYSYALRQPPFTFNPGQLGGNQNFFGSASQFRPFVYPGFGDPAAAAAAAAATGSGSGNAPNSNGGPSPAAVSQLWNNYKQWASPNGPNNEHQNNNHGAAANTANYAWSPPGGAATGGAYGMNNNGNNGQNFHPNQGGQNQGNYQGAASMNYPNTFSNVNYNQRTSSTNFKPVHVGHGGGGNNNGNNQQFSPDNRSSNSGSGSGGSSNKVV